MPTQYMASKTLHHNNHTIDMGEVVPGAWVEEWEQLGAVGKMISRRQITMVPAGSDPLPEAEPKPTAYYQPAVEVVPEHNEAWGAPNPSDFFDDHAVSAEDPEEDEDTETEEAEEDTEEEEDAFDPSEVSVAKVKEFVAQYPQLASDIHTAESEGKARKGLLTWLEEMIEQEETE